MIDLAGPRWAHALSAGLGARMLAVDAGRHVSVAVFRAGPFRVAYPDFPVGADSYAPDRLAALLEACEAERVDVVRLHVQKIPAWRGPMTTYAMGTARIVDLAAWNDSAGEKARRTRNRAARSAVRIIESTAADGDRLHELYLGTVERHAGRVRYTRAYFREIAALGCPVAVLDGRLVGFVCSGTVDGVAYYLHGGQDPQARSAYPSDLLFRHMILEARDAGARSFDFLPSPPGQPSLQQYKLAWGGEPGAAFAVDLALRPLRARALRLARTAADALPPSLVRRLMSSRDRES